MQIRTITDPLTGSNCYIVEEDSQVILIDPNLAEEIIRRRVLCWIILR